jgi:hypothetical protein
MDLNKPLFNGFKKLIIFLKQNILQTLSSNGNMYYMILILYIGDFLKTKDDID